MSSCSRISRAGGTTELRERVTRLEDLIGVPVEGEEANQTVMVDMEEIWSELQSLRTIIEN